MKWIINAGKNKQYAANGTAHVLDGDHALCKVRADVNGFRIQLKVSNNGTVVDAIAPENTICPNCEKKMEAKGYTVKDGMWVERWKA